MMTPTPLHLALIGNSILYYHDCPRLLEQMLLSTKQYVDVQQNSCLRGGASLASLLEQGNGMRHKFQNDMSLQPDGTYDIGAATVDDLLQEHPNIVILQDHTQGPARQASRAQGLQVLEDRYSKMMNNAAKQKPSKVILLQTAAYRTDGIHQSHDLGSFEEFTQQLTKGYQLYQEVLQKKMHVEDCVVVIAPVGQAYAYLRSTNPELWKRLYAMDDFHPSPLGTYLQACVLYIVITRLKPPDYNSHWWSTQRYRQPNQGPPHPTPDEAQLLAQAAIQVCQEEYLNHRDETSKL